MHTSARRWFVFDCHCRGLLIFTASLSRHNRHDGRSPINHARFSTHFWPFFLSNKHTDFNWNGFPLTLRTPISSRVFLFTIETMISLTFLFQVSIIRKVGSSSLYTMMRGVSHDAPLSVPTRRWRLLRLPHRPTAVEEWRSRFGSVPSTFSFLSLLVCVCHCCSCRLTQNPAYDARLCCIRGGKKTLGAQGTRLLRLLSRRLSTPTRLLFAGSSRQQQEQHHRTHTRHNTPSPEKPKMLLGLVFPFFFLSSSLLSAWVFFSRMRQGGRKGMRFWVVRWDDERVLRAEIENTSREGRE